MMSSPPEQRILQAAAAWFACLRDENVSTNDHLRWQAWLAEHPAHRAAWDKVEAISGQIAALPPASAAGLSAPQRRRFVQAAVLSALGLASWPVIEQWPTWHASHHTARGETRKIILADGSTLWLSSASAVNVDFSATVRRLQLIAGEALLQTASDTRPLQFSSKHATYQPLGTLFSLNLHNGYDVLAVYQGYVQAYTTTGITKIVRAGQQFRVSEAQIDAQGAALNTQLAWRDGLLLADQMPLAEFCAAVARFRGGWIDCAPELAQHKLVGAYPLNNPDQALRSLSLALPVRVQLWPWWARVLPRAD